MKKMLYIIACCTLLTTPHLTRTLNKNEIKTVQKKVEDATKKLLHEAKKTGKEIADTAKHIVEKTKETCTTQNITRAAQQEYNNLKQTAKTVKTTAEKIAHDAATTTKETCTSYKNIATTFAKKIKQKTTDLEVQINHLIEKHKYNYRACANIMGWATSLSCIAWLCTEITCMKALKKNALQNRDHLLARINQSFFIKTTLETSLQAMIYSIAATAGIYTYKAIQKPTKKTKLFTTAKSVMRLLVGSLICLGGGAMLGQTIAKQNNAEPLYGYMVGAVAGSLLLPCTAWTWQPIDPQ